MKKRFLSLLLVVSLLIAMLPPTVFAAEGNAKSGTIFIDTVEVTFTAPRVGAYPVYSASVDSGANYFVDPDNGAWWYDINHSFLPQNAKFESGMSYIFEVLIRPKDGYTLGNATSCYLNGHPVGAEYFDTEDGGVLIVAAYFPLDDIKTVSITITEPKAGTHPDYNPVLPDEIDLSYHPADFHSSGVENGVRWDETESWETLMVLSGTFENLHAYSVTSFVEAQFGHSFNPSATVYVNGKQATIAYINADHTIISIRYDFPALIPSGWAKIDGKWYYYAGGKAVTGWKKISNKWYFFESSGIMQTGWQKISGKWYYLSSSGAMLTGMQKISGKWYYLESSGAMFSGSGWKQIDNKWYYFNSSSVALTGWQKISGKWYYFNSSAVMVTGWQKISGKWYYFNGGGDMVTGWKKISNKWYYFESSGAMVADTSKTINGKTYYFSSSGACMNP